MNNVLNEFFKLKILIFLLAGIWNGCVPFMEGLGLGLIFLVAEDVTLK